MRIVVLVQTHAGSHLRNKHNRMISIRAKFPFLRFTLMLISRLFEPGFHTCFLILTLVLLLIAQVGTGLKLSQIMSQIRCRIFYQAIRSDRVCSEIYCLQTACTSDGQGSQGGLVVIYRASHHCEPGFNSGLSQHVG